MLFLLRFWKLLSSNCLPGFAYVLKRVSTIPPSCYNADGIHDPASGFLNLPLVSGCFFRTLFLYIQFFVLPYIGCPYSVHHYLLVYENRFNSEFSTITRNMIFLVSTRYSMGILIHAVSLQYMSANDDHFHKPTIPSDSCMA